MIPSPPPRPPAQVLEELAAIIQSAGTFQSMGGYSADYFRYLCGQWAEQLRELSAIVRGQEKALARVKADKRQRHVYGCPLDGEPRTEPCTDCDEAIATIHPRPPLKDGSGRRPQATGRHAGRGRTAMSDREQELLAALKKAETHVHLAYARNPHVAEFASDLALVQKAIASADASASPAKRPTLFKSGAFTLHSGQTDVWKIDCAALTDGDWFTLAQLIALRVGRFSDVEGVPTGGLKLAFHLLRHRSADGPVLLVDDVLTTGASMEQQRAGREAIGAVVFARGPVPSWVTPLFRLSGASASRAVSPEQQAVIEEMRGYAKAVVCGGRPISVARVMMWADRLAALSQPEQQEPR